jgi:hypothetical protein
VLIGKARYPSTEERDTPSIFLTFNLREPTGAIKVKLKWLHFGGRVERSSANLRVISCSSSSKR